MTQQEEKGSAYLDDSQFKQDFSKDENEERGNWSGRLDFLLSCLGYAVGLGNVWRFPYLCYKNGGAAFFIPYIIMLCFVGMPIFFLELSLGQFTSNSALTCWNFANIFKGIGTAMVIVSAMVAIYYNMIIAWAIYYLVASFTSFGNNFVLPWASCNKAWASPYCSDYLATDAVNCTDLGYSAQLNGVCMNGTSVYGIWNETMAEANGIKKRLATDEYLNRFVLGKDFGSMENYGTIRWQLLLSYLAAWIIVCLCLIRGIKSSGKVVYFTAIFPYVVLIILLVRGLTLPNYYEGIEFYILKPKWSVLSDAQVWKDAAVQIFFSLSASWGGLITLSSYNRFHNDVLRDSLIVTIGNCLTSFFAGFVIFSFLGYLAGTQGTTVDKVAEGGVGLAFIVYPAAVTTMSVSPLWAILFFVMLITLGLDSEFALVETVTTSIMDQVKSLRKKKSLVMIVTCTIFFALGLTLTTYGGSHMLQLMDHYSGGWNVLVISFLECVSVAYVYGYNRFKEDIRTMVGQRVCCLCPWNICYSWWCICWSFFTPAGVLFILVFSLIQFKPASYGDYKYPIWADALGWLMTLAVVLSIFITAIVMVIVTPGGLLERLRKLFTPNEQWGPALPQHRQLVTRYVPNFQVHVEGMEMNNMKSDDSKLGSDNQAYEKMDE